MSHNYAKTFLACYIDIDCLAQERRNSIASTLGLRPSCTNPSIGNLISIITIRGLLPCKITNRHWNLLNSWIISVVHFVRSKPAIPPCSVQNFEAIWQMRNRLRANKISRWFEFSGECWMYSICLYIVTAPGLPVGVTKPISSVPLFSEFFTIVKTRVTSSTSRSYLTGVTPVKYKSVSNNLRVFFGKIEYFLNGEINADSVNTTPGRARKEDPAGRVETLCWPRVTDQ